nr:MAG TPA: CRISPR system Cascade subunit CasE, Cascade, RNA Surveillance, Adaptive [Caudoviricetes sp.]
MCKNTVKMDCFGCGLLVCRRRIKMNCRFSFGCRPPHRFHTIPQRQG